MEELFLDNYPIPDYYTNNPMDYMSDEELAEMFADMQAEDAIEYEKSNPSDYYYEP